MQLCVIIALLGSALDLGVSAQTEVDAPAATARAGYLDGGRQRWVTPIGYDASLALLEVRIEEAETGLRYPAWLDEHVIVQLRAEQRAAPAAALASLGVAASEPLMESVGLYRVRGPESDPVALAARLRAEHGDVVGEAMPDIHLMHKIAQSSTPPDDPRLGGQWYFNKLGMEDAWALSTGDESVEILVVDTGCDPVHPDLVDKYEMGIDVLDDDFLPDPEVSETCTLDEECGGLFGCVDGRCRHGNEHGTACAGLVAASTNNGIGIAGACPECRLRCARLLGNDGTPTAISDDVTVFDFARDQGVAVVSNSWGFTAAVSVPFALATAIQDVFDNGRGGKGALVFFAAGNDNREVQSYELLAVRGVLGIGAVTNFDEVTSFSNRGASVDLVAHTGTLTTDISGDDGASVDDYTSEFGGTSSACPVAAGIGGLAVSVAPELTSIELAEALVETARSAYYAQPDQYGHDDEYGYGIIDPAAALRRLLGIEDQADGGVGGDDAGAPDEADAGITDDEPPPDCGCAGGGDAAPLVAFGALLAMLRPRRRRTS